MIADPMDLALPGVVAVAAAMLFLEGVTAPLIESTAETPDRSRFGAGEGVTPAVVRLPNAELLVRTVEPLAL